MQLPDRACALCGKPIDVGEAWMSSDEEGAKLVAHSGCVYSEPPEADDRGRWVPSEIGPSE